VTERLTLILATLILAVIGLLPVAAMLGETLIADGGFSVNAYRALLSSDGQFLLLMGHSLQLSLLTAIVSTLVGVPLGVLLGKTDLPLRGAFTLLSMSWLLLGFPSWGERGFSVAYCRMNGRKKSPRHSSGCSAALLCSHPPSCPWRCC
jgi:ABC-type Fe3+ transport system permease subunit